MAGMYGANLRPPSPGIAPQQPRRLEPQFRLTLGNHLHWSAARGDQRRPYVQQKNLAHPQIATSSPGSGGERYLPRAFTQHGALVAGMTLNSAHAVEISVHVVRAFVRLRDLLVGDKELAKRCADLERKLATR